MSLLSLVQRAADLIAIPRPAVVVSSTDQQVRQLFALANEEGASLAARYDWQALTRQHTFTTTSDAAQTDAVPDDWDRFVDNSFFNRSTRRGLIGPITPQVWQAIQAQPQLNRVYLAWRERDNEFLITPSPDPDETIAYEYVSTNWARGADGTAKSEFTADDDTTYLSERLIWLGLRWRFLKAKGLEYGEDMETYEREVQKAAARDGGAAQLNITGRDSYILSPNIPEGQFPGPGGPT